MRIAIVYGNDGSYPRIIKTCNSLVKLGHEVHFIGWDRRQQPANDIKPDGIQAHILRHATPFGRSTLWAQCRFSVHTARCLAHIRPDIVCAANEENAIRVLPFRNVFYRKLVCDVVDCQRDVGSARPLPIRLLVSLITECARIGSDTLIATDHARFNNFGRHQSKTKIIGNYPEDPGDQLWRQRPVGSVKLYVSGSLAESRGLRQILSVVDQSEGVSIIAAGTPNDKFSSETFINHPKVSWRGYIPLEYSLKLASECDATFAFYAPSCRNNILASPTKLYEAMSVGRPVVINTEARVSAWVVKNALGFACPFNDEQQLRDIVQSLADLRAEFPKAAEHSRRLFRNAYSWDKQEAIFDEIYGPSYFNLRSTFHQEAA